MSATLDAVSAADPSPSTTTRSAVFGRRWLHGAAVVRILFGVLWACDASFKWQPGFIHGRTLPDELGKVAQIHSPVIHQWLALTHMVGMANPRHRGDHRDHRDAGGPRPHLRSAVECRVRRRRSSRSASGRVPRRSTCPPFRHDRSRAFGRLHLRVTGPVLRGGRLDLERRHLAAPASRSIRLAGSARCRGQRRLIDRCARPGLIPLLGRRGVYARAAADRADSPHPRPDVSRPERKRSGTGWVSLHAPCRLPRERGEFGRWCLDRYRGVAPRRKLQRR